MSCLHAPSAEPPARARRRRRATDPLATGSASNSGTPFVDVVTSSYANPVCGGRDSTRAVTTRCASREVRVDPDEPHRYHASRRYVAPAARDATAPRCARARTVARRRAGTASAKFDRAGARLTRARGVLRDAPRETRRLAAAVLSCLPAASTSIAVVVRVGGKACAPAATGTEEPSQWDDVEVERAEVAGHDSRVRSEGKRGRSRRRFRGGRARWRRLGRDSTPTTSGGARGDPARLAAKAFNFTDANVGVACWWRRWVYGSSAPPLVDEITRGRPCPSVAGGAEGEHAATGCSGLSVSMGRVGASRGSATV